MYQRCYTNCWKPCTSTSVPQLQLAINEVMGIIFTHHYVARAVEI